MLRPLQQRVQRLRQQQAQKAAVQHPEASDRMEKLAACLRNPAPYEVHVGDSLAPAARLTLERMLEYAAK